MAKSKLNGSDGSKSDRLNDASEQVDIGHSTANRVRMARCAIFILHAFYATRTPNCCVNEREEAITNAMSWQWSKPSETYPGDAYEDLCCIDFIRMFPAWLFSVCEENIAYISKSFRRKCLAVWMWTGRKTNTCDSQHEFLDLTRFKVASNAPQLKRIPYKTLNAENAWEVLFSQQSTWFSYGKKIIAMLVTFTQIISITINSLPSPALKAPSVIIHKLQVLCIRAFCHL